MTDYEKAFEKGYRDQARRTALRMHELGFDLQTIARIVGFEKETVKEWIEGKNAKI